MWKCCFVSAKYHGYAANNNDHCRDNDDHFMSSFGWLGYIGGCSR